MSGRISWTGVFVGLAGAVLAAAVSRATGSGWLPAIGLALLLSVGLYLWAQDPEKGWGDLGESVMVSVIVAIALMAVQRDAEEKTRKATDDAELRREQQIRRAEAARQRAAERENLQLSLTLQRDLRGIALADRDLGGFLLAGKNFERADLQGANLTGADLRGARFRSANLLGVTFDRARMERADLSGATLSPEDFRLVPDTRGSAGNPASLRGAELSDASLRNLILSEVDFAGAVLVAADLRGVVGRGELGLLGPSFRDAALVLTDLRGASLADADFRGAVLGGARFCGASGLGRADFTGAVYDARTRWPPGFDPIARGARKARSSRRARTFESLGGPVRVTGGPRNPACKR